MEKAADERVTGYFPLAGTGNNGWSTDTHATATCFCGAVQLSFPTEEPGMLGTFVCNCSDCHKITASMFTTAFIVDDNYLTHERGRDNLKTFSQKHSIASGKLVTNYFCSTCGSLMYRVGESLPGKSVLRVGTVDDFSLHNTKLKPQMELFTKDKVGWSGVIQGVKQFEGSF